MKQVTERQEVESLLRKYEYEFVKSNPSLQGNIEPLTEEDIDNILYDMNRGLVMGAKMYKDDNKVVVKYPDNVCVLESRGEIKGQ